MKYYKTDLIKAVEKSMNWVHADAERAVNAVFGEITKCLKQGHEIQVTGFGTFYNQDRKPSKRVNFDGNVVKIRKHKLPAFKAGTLLKKAVNRKK